MIAVFKKTSRAALVMLFSIGLGLTGCLVGPKYHRPEVNAPQNYRGDVSNVTNSFGDLPWWEVFQDAELQNLMRAALTNNFDLRIAVARVDQARALARQSRAELLPQVNYAGTAAVGKNVGANGPSPGQKQGTVYSADVNASWEIDISGRVRRRTEAAYARYEAMEEARRDVLVSLIAQVAQDYFQLLSLDQQLVIAQSATNSFGESLRLFKRRLEGGVASKLETSSAEGLLASSAAQIPELKRQITAVENQICVLLGQNPGPIARTSDELASEKIPDVPPGLPASLLERRPDVREAEQALRAANADVGVAEGNFLPQLNLTGLLGQVSPEAAMLTSGGAFAWGAAASLTGPIFHGGALKAQYQQALAARREAVLTYQKTVLTAFQEVSSALVARQNLMEAREQQARAVVAYQEAVKVVKERYLQGQSSYFEVLQEQQQLFPAQNNLVQTEANQLTTMVQLYRALGGGWKK